MKLIIVRHAIAEDRVEFKKKKLSDAKRPLTKKGIKIFTKNIKHILKVLPKAEKLYSSDLVRAVQTAAIISKKTKLKNRMLRELRPAASFESLIKKIKKNKVAIIVGHEPFLSEFIGYLVGNGDKDSLIAKKIKMKKGGVILLSGEKLDRDSMQIESLA